MKEPDKPKISKGQRLVNAHKNFQNLFLEVKEKAAQKLRNEEESKQDLILPPKKPDLSIRESTFNVPQNQDSPEVQQARKGIRQLFAKALIREKMKQKQPKVNVTDFPRL